MTIFVEVVDGTIVFDLPAAERDKITKLDGLTVTRATGVRGESEIVWRAWGHSRFKEEARIHWPLRYGSKIANTILHVPPKPLRPGRYRFTADVDLLTPGETKDDDSSRMLFLEFEIDSELKRGR